MEWTRRRVAATAAVAAIAITIAIVVAIDRTSPAGEPVAVPWRLGSDPHEQIVTSVYTTGYTWFDNTPPGSGRISHPVRHRRAGGTGTYDDPLTMAVGHSLASGRDVLDIPAGTLFYVSHVRRYFIVEDSCGDGASPQRAGCHDLSHAPRGAKLWVDLFVGGGEDDDRSDVQHCAGIVTDGDHTFHMIVANPRRDYVVVKGSLFQDGECTKLYSGISETEDG